MLPSAAPEIQAPAGAAAGRCYYCERTYQLNHRGYLRTHRAWVVRRGAVTRIEDYCAGSGCLPEVTA